MHETIDRSVGPNGDARFRDEWSLSEPVVSSSLRQAMEPISV